MKYMPAVSKTHHMMPLLLLCLLTLSGCATQKMQPTQTQANAHTASIANLSEKPLNSEFVYEYLVAEIAGQRGDYATSGSIFYQLAKNEEDARFAERAAKIAVYGNVGNLVFPAVELWAHLDPSSTEAQQAMTEILIKTDRLSEAEPYISQLLTKEDTRASGFLFINNLLNRSPNKLGVLFLTQSLAEPYPNLAEAHFSIAQAAINANRNDIALDALNRAEKLKSGWGLAAILKGQLLFAESPQKAIEYHQAFLKKYPKSNEIRLNLCKMLVSQKQYALAKNEFPTIMAEAKQEVAKRSLAEKSTPQEQARNANRLDLAEKNLADISAVLGMLAMQGEDYPTAKEYFEEALKSDFKEPEQVYLYLGQISEKQHDDATAQAWYEKVAVGNHYLESRLNIANIIARQSSPEQAIKFLDEVDNLSTEQQILVIQAEAQMLARAKRPQEAFDLLAKAVNNMPNTPELVYDYALLGERIGKYDVMEKELRRVIQEKPNFAAAYNALGYSFADRNIKLDEALTLIQKALELSPNDHYMLDSLGWVYYKKGDLTQAENYLKQAFDIHPDPEIAAHLGEVLWQKGQREQAKKIWGDALRADPENEVLLTTHRKFNS
jgi:tetratricopeptide (TPR) repeat protein